MFDTLSERLARTIKDLKGQGRLTEDNIAAAMREVRMALLEADVALPVTRDFYRTCTRTCPGSGCNDKPDTGAGGCEDCRRRTHFTHG